MSGRPFLLAAGGTGGHLSPAAALAQELKRRGYAVELATDLRAAQYGIDFPARKIHSLNAATITGRNPVALARTFGRLGLGYFSALRLLATVRPYAVIGFGGYPTLPPLIAARTLGIPSAIHEQNAVMGRANRLLGRFADRIALTFAETKFLDGKAKKKSVLTGTPVRDEVLRYRMQAYTVPTPEGRLLLLIFGGSQGAHFFSDIFPKALPRLSEGLRKRLTVVQQCRPEDIEPARAAYEAAGMAVHLAPFFRDLPERIANAQLVVARAGASTVAELTVIGRPGLLVPLPHSLDNDQLENATRLADAGAGWCAEQKHLTVDALVEKLESLLSNPAALADAAAKAHAMGETESVAKLADLAESLADLKD